MTSAMALEDSAETWTATSTRFPFVAQRVWRWEQGPTCPIKKMPLRLVAAAESRGPPLLEVPAGTPFMLVTTAIVDARTDLDRQLLERSFTLQRELTMVAAREGGLTGLVQAWHSATGETFVVLDGRGRRLAGSPDFPTSVSAAVSTAVPGIPLLIEDFVPITTEAGAAVVSSVGVTRHAGYLARLGDSFELGTRAVPTLLSLLAPGIRAALARRRTGAPSTRQPAHPPTRYRRRSTRRGATARYRYSRQNRSGSSHPSPVRGARRRGARRYHRRAGRSPGTST